MGVWVGVNDSGLGHVPVHTAARAAAARAVRTASASARRRPAPRAPRRRSVDTVLSRADARWMCVCVCVCQHHIKQPRKTTSTS